MQILQTTEKEATTTRPTELKAHFWSGMKVLYSRWPARQPFKRGEGGKKKNPKPKHATHPRRQKCSLPSSEIHVKTRHEAERVLEHPLLAHWTFDPLAVAEPLLSPSPGDAAAEIWKEEPCASSGACICQSQHGGQLRPPPPRTMPRAQPDGCASFFQFWTPLPHSLGLRTGPAKRKTKHLLPRFLTSSCWWQPRIWKLHFLLGQ